MLFSTDLKKDKPFFLIAFTLIIKYLFILRYFGGFMLSSFFDLQTFALFFTISLLLAFLAFRFDLKALRKNHKKMSGIFLSASIIVFASDVILYLQDKDFLTDEPVVVAKTFGVMFLSLFYGIVFASISWFSSTEDA